MSRDHLMIIYGTFLQSGFCGRLYIQEFKRPQQTTLIWRGLTETVNKENTECTCIRMLEGHFKCLIANKLKQPVYMIALVMRDAFSTGMV